MLGRGCVWARNRGRVTGVVLGFALVAFLSVEVS